MFKKAIYRFAIICTVLALSLAALPATVAHAAGTIIVNTTDGAALGSPSDGKCSLREAVQAATLGGSSTNGDCTGGTAGIDTIAFNLPGSGVQTISLGAFLSIDTPMIIDGTTQPGYSGTPLVRIDGGSLNIHGIRFNGASDGSTLKGMMVTRFNYALVIVLQSDNMKIVGNYIGTDGSSDFGGATGILVDHSNGVIIGGPTAAERNVITGNEGDLELEGSSTGASIQGNFIGVYANGAASPSGSQWGVMLATLPQANTGASSNKIGGLAAGEGNVIAGHSAADVALYSDDWSFSDNNVIQGNMIGINSAGNGLVGMPLGNGIMIVNSDNTLVEGNLISGKTGSGIDVLWDGSFVKGGGTPVAPDHTLIRSNKIGTSLNGLIALGNGTGVLLSSATNTTIGGNGNVSQHNLISGNTKGIDIEGGSGNVVDTNLLGVNAVGTASLPNTSNGLYINSNVQVSRNVIANSSTGVYVTGSGTISFAVDNCVTGNSTYGFNNLTGSSITFTNTWWGSATGPTHSSNPAGTGDKVSDFVTFNPFSTLAPSACSSQQMQMLKNPSFEIDANLNNKPDNWTLTNFNAVTDKRDCTIHQAGTCSLKLAGNGAQKTASETILKNGVAGDDFSFSLWSKANKIPSGSVYRLQVKFFNGTTLLAKKTRNFTTGTHSFQKVSGTFTAPGPYTKVVFKIVLVAASGSAWFDTAGLNWAP